MPLRLAVDRNLRAVAKRLSLSPSLTAARVPLPLAAAALLVAAVAAAALLCALLAPALPPLPAAPHLFAPSRPAPSSHPFLPCALRPDAAPAAEQRPAAAETTLVTAIVAADPAHRAVLRRAVTHYLSLPHPVVVVVVAAARGEPSSSFSSSSASSSSSTQSRQTSDVLDSLAALRRVGAGSSPPARLAVHVVRPHPHLNEAAALNLAAALAATPSILVAPLGVLPPPSLSLPAPAAPAACLPHADAPPAALCTARAAFCAAAGLDERVAAPRALEALAGRLRLVTHAAPCRRLAADVAPDPAANATSATSGSDSGAASGTEAAVDATASWAGLEPAAAIYDTLRLDRAAPWTAALSTTYSRLYGGTSPPASLGAASFAVASPAATLPPSSPLAAAALRAHLRDDHGVPLPLTTHLALPQLRHLARALAAPDAAGGLLVAHVAHGLGNRLRALAGAAAAARATRRALLIVWPRDAHCHAAFGDLFEAAPRGAVVTARLAVDPAPRGGAQRWAAAVFGRTGDDDSSDDGSASAGSANGGGGGGGGGGVMAGRWIVRDELSTASGAAMRAAPLNLTLAEGRHVYVRSANALETTPRAAAGWAAANRELRAMRAVAWVRARAAAAAPRARRSICVHARHAGLARDVRGVAAAREYGAVEAEVIGAWRAAAAPGTFAQEAQRLLLLQAAVGTGGSGGDVLIAADEEATRAAVRDRLASSDARGWSVFDSGGSGQEEVCHGRETQCVKMALVELLVLAQCPVVLGSMWSSFSEAVGRLSGRAVRLAGMDFGAVDTGGLSAAAAQRVSETVARRKLRRRGKRRGRGQ